MTLEEEYPELKKEFPNEFPRLFNKDGKLNFQGGMAKELIDFRGDTDYDTKETLALLHNRLSR